MNVLFVAVNRNGGRKWHILRAPLTTKVLNSNSYYYLLLVFFFSSLPHFCSCRYLNLVPSIPEINAPGINWTEEELNELKGSDILQQLLDYSKQVDRKFKGVAKHVSALSRWFMFCLLVCSFASFTLCLARPKHRLTLFAHPPPALSRQVLALYPEIFLKEAYTREHYRWAHAILDSRRIWWNGEGSLVPMLDLVNCAEGPDSTRVHSTWLDEETQSYAVTKGKGVVLLFEGSTFGSTSVLHLS
jgi:hypothetical protein